MVNDEQLWKKLKTGDRGALEMLFRRYHKDLYRYGVRFCGDPHMTEDQIQDLFLKLWDRRENLGDVKAVKTYLWTALRRELVTAMKKKKQVNGSDVSSPKKFSLPAEEVIIQDEQRAAQKRDLEKAVETLSPRQREILYLRFYEGMTYEEVEAIMSINYQIARNYMYTCLEKLRETMSAGSSVVLFFLFCNLILF